MKTAPTTPGTQTGPGCWMRRADDLIPADLAALRAEMTNVRDWRHFLHVERLLDGSVRTLIVTSNLTNEDLGEAHLCYFGIRKWRAMSVGVQGSLKVRLADQQAIGRKRHPGERTPAPLPDWFDLTHLVYVHATETGFDPKRDIWQFLPAPHHEYVNFAEALHVRQPA